MLLDGITSLCDTNSRQQHLSFLSFRVPSVIKRNMVLFALSQTFTGAGMRTGDRTAWMT
jgi:hypothetical protein